MLISIANGILDFLLKKKKKKKKNTFWQPLIKPPKWSKGINYSRN